VCSGILTCVIGVGLLGATPAWAAKLTCLTGSDPAVVFDAGQIAYARDYIQYFACNCSSFDGSPGKTRADYLKCAKGQVDRVLVANGWLRKQCKGTVKAYYSKSTCGQPASRRKTA